MAKGVKTRITSQGMAYLVAPILIFIGAIIQRINPLVLLTGLLVGPLILSWRIVRRMLSTIEARRNFPREIAAGDLFVVELTAKNTGRRQCWAVRCEDQIRRLGEPLEPNSKPEILRPLVLFSRVLPGKSVTGAYRGRLMQRGRYELGPLKSTSEFPLGLLRGTKELAGKESLLVLPRLGTLNGRWLQLHREAEVGSLQTHQRHSGHEGEFFGLRDWRSGDSVRWIHWRTTAKRGRLSVRQFEKPRNQDFALIVDLWKPAQAKAHELDCVELAVSFAATIIADLFRGGGSHLTFALSAKEQLLSTGPVATALVRDLMERLALTEATTDTAQLPKLLQRAYAEIRPNMSVVLVTTRDLDIMNRQDYPDLWSDSTKSQLTARTVVVSTASLGLYEYFEPSLPANLIDGVAEPNSVAETRKAAHVT